MKYYQMKLVAQLATVWNTVPGDDPTDPEYYDDTYSALVTTDEFNYEGADLEFHTLVDSLDTCEGYVSIHSVTECIFAIPYGYDADYFVGFGGHPDTSTVHVKVDARKYDPDQIVLANLQVGNTYKLILVGKDWFVLEGEDGPL